MPSVINVDINSLSSSYTKARITSMTVVPRTDAAGSRVTLGLRVTMGPSSALGFHPTDKSLGRKFTGKLNGYNIPDQVIKRYNIVDDNWNYDTAYNYTIKFDIPYSPGTIYCDFQIIEQGPGALSGKSVFYWPTNTYTIVSTAAVLPGAPTAVKFNNYSGQYMVANMLGTYNLTWTAPASGGTGGVKSYNIYVSSNGSSWNYYTNTTASPRKITLSDRTMARGASVYFMVRAVNLYGVSSNATGPYVTLARLPSAPTVAYGPLYSSYNKAHTVQWLGAAAGDGVIKKYEVYVRIKRKGSTTWSAWVIATVAYTSPVTLLATSYFSDVVPGDTVQYKIYTVNSFDLVSPTGKETGEIVLKGGIIRINIGGTWKEGIVFIKQGSWKEANAVYVKKGTTWKEGI